MQVIGRRRYRVVQWATGNKGMRSLRAAIESPDLELVGLYVYSDAKEGVDAGELCGLAPTGVIATRDIEEILALKPDCVLYMANQAEIDVICRLLESAANVVTTREEFHRPDSMDPNVRERVEAACRRGGSSIHSTGASPGFITEAVPLVMTSIQRRLDCLTIEEFADISLRNSPEKFFDFLGFGKDPATFDPWKVQNRGAEKFGDSLALLADALAMPLDDIVATGEVAVARETVEVAAGKIKAGTIGAQRMEVTGLRNGQPLIRFRASWYMTRNVDPTWDLRQTGWHLLVEGDAPLEIDIRFPVPPERWAEVSPAMTAHRPVNAIPYVCEAEPGIRTTADLPQIIAKLG
jgi:2,4-diaminopentanoate dehydrogenase